MKPLQLQLHKQHGFCITCLLTYYLVVQMAYSISDKKNLPSMNNQKNELNSISLSNDTYDQYPDDSYYYDNYDVTDSNNTKHKNVNDDDYDIFESLADDGDYVLANSTNLSDDSLEQSLDEDYPILEEDKNEKQTNTDENQQTTEFKVSSHVLFEEISV